MAPTKLERQLKAITALGSEFGACFTDCTYVGSQGFYVGNQDLRLSAFQQAGLEACTEFGQLDATASWVLARYPAIRIQSLLVLRSLLEEVNAFDEVMVTAEDTELLFRLAFKTRFCFGIDGPRKDRPDSVAAGGPL